MKLLLETFDSVETIHARQTNIQQNEIRWSLPRERKRIFSICSGTGTKPSLFQIECETTAHESIIIYEQNVSCHIRKYKTKSPCQKTDRAIALCKLICQIFQT